MTDNLDSKALAHLTDEERQLLADEADTLLEDATAPDSGLTLHGRVIGTGDDDTASETAAAPSGRAAREDDETELRRDPAPLLDISIPRDLPQRIAALDEEKAELVYRFDSGDIAAREYADGLQQIADRRSDVEWMRRKAELARESHERAINGNWDAEVKLFMTTTAKDIAEKGEAALLAFDSYVKKVTSDPANARLSDRAQLAKAHKLFEADFGKLPASRAQRAYEPTPRARAEEPTVDTGRFADLDGLADSNPRAFEKAIARMSEAEREAYLR